MAGRQIMIRSLPCMRTVRMCSQYYKMNSPANQRHLICDSIKDLQRLPDIYGWRTDKDKISFAHAHCAYARSEIWRE
jgi:hypothetical protein